MASDHTRESRWHEREVSLILKRAVELQEEERPQSPSALARREGASLAELEEMARELGVDPALVRRAAGELEMQPRPAPVSRWSGGPETIVFERVMPGELSQAGSEGLVGVIQDAFGESGQPSMVGRTVFWTAIATAGRRDPHARELSITVTPRDGVTTIRVEEKLRGTLRRLFGGMMGGGTGLTWGLAAGVGVGALHSAVAAVTLGLCSIGSVYAGARAIYRHTVRTRTEELQRVMTRIAEHVETELDGAALPAGSSEGQPLLKGR